jgi:hypothetical protein
MNGMTHRVLVYRLSRAWAPIGAVVVFVAFLAGAPDDPSPGRSATEPAVAQAVEFGLLLAVPFVVAMSRLVAAALAVAVAALWFTADPDAPHWPWLTGATIAVYAVLACYGAIPFRGAEQVEWLLPARRTEQPTRPHRMPWVAPWRWWWVAGLAVTAGLFTWFAARAQAIADDEAGSRALAEDTSGWYAVPAATGGLALGVLAWILADRWAVARFFRTPQPVREVGVADLYNGVLVVGPLPDPYWAVEIPVRPAELARHAPLDHQALLYGEPFVDTWCAVVTPAGDVITPTGRARRPGLSLVSMEDQLEKVSQDLGSPEL